MIVKETQPAGSTQEFEFRKSWDEPITLRGGESHDSGRAAAGHGVRGHGGRARGLGAPVRDLQRRQPGHEHRAVRRRDGHLHVHEPQVSAGTIVVRKATEPSPDTTGYAFAFEAGGGLTPTSFTLKDGESRTFADLPRSPATAWRRPLRPAGISQALPATTAARSPTSTSAPGETVTCTFRNRQRGKIVIRKQTEPDNSPQTFQFTTSYGPGFALRDDESNESAFLVPGNGYNVAESLPAGWDLTEATCDDGSPVTNIDVAPGETVTCTFNNRQRGKIVIRKQTDPDGAASRFRSRPATARGFSLARRRVERLRRSSMPGSGYNVAETAARRLGPDQATCDDGSPVTNIDARSRRDRHLHLPQPPARQDHDPQADRAGRRPSLPVHDRATSPGFALRDGEPERQPAARARHRLHRRRDRSRPAGT